MFFKMLNSNWECKKILEHCKADSNSELIIALGFVRVPKDHVFKFEFDASAMS